MKHDDRHKRVNVVYSTNPDFHYDTGESDAPETLPNDRQNLRVSLDKRNRGGKQVTLITGFVGNEDDLQSLCKLLKTKCGVGGSAKDNEIIIQGDVRSKVVILLNKEGYTKVKVI
ncbi:MAG: translation initiation factor [Dysgonamonadaceae bacterium]|jgi:translation initiation factor 1|nr:translation initiation factor [Dysgonamonadaceae bacterium]